MKKLNKGYYTCDVSDLYVYVVPQSYKEDYVKATVIMYYKYGEYKDYEVDKGEYKLYYNNINHWYEYDPEKSVD